MTKANKGRTTVYNNITTPEKIAQIDPENRTLIDDFLSYLESIGRAETTLRNYKADLLIFFCYVLDNLENKKFVNITKREISRFQNHALKVWKWSPNRLRTVKATVSSLSNYIENILDDDYENFRSIVRKVESPPKTAVREKTILTSQDIETILEYFTENHKYEEACLIALAAFSGRRKSELCRFKVSDFDDSRLVCDGALYKSEPIRTKGRGGGKYLNCYVLAKRFKPYFDAWMKDREERGIDSEYLFVSKEDNTKVLLCGTIDVWMNICTKVIDKPVYAHAFRHAFTTYLLTAGIPDSAVQSIMGWSSADMLRVYDDRSNDEQITAFFKDGDIAVNGNKPSMDKL